MRCLHILINLKSIIFISSALYIYAYVRIYTIYYTWCPKMSGKFFGVSSAYQNNKKTSYKHMSRLNLFSNYNEFYSNYNEWFFRQVNTDDRRFLNWFSNEWSDLIACSTLSPDLNPVDFYLWGHLKSMVYRTAIDSIETRRKRIEQNFQ